MIFQLKIFLCVKFMFPPDSMFELVFISHFYAVVIHIIQKFYLHHTFQDAMPAAALRA